MAPNDHRTSVMEPISLSTATLFPGCRRVGWQSGLLQSFTCKPSVKACHSRWNLYLRWLISVDAYKYIQIYEYMIYTYWAHHFLTFLPKEEKLGNQLFFWMALRKLIVWILAPCVCSLCTKFRNNNQHEFLKLMRRPQRQKKRK